MEFIGQGIEAGTGLLWCRNDGFTAPAMVAQHRQRQGYASASVLLRPASAPTNQRPDIEYRGDAFAAGDQGLDHVLEPEQFADSPWHGVALFERQGDLGRSAIGQQQHRGDAALGQDAQPQRQQATCARDP